jgi:DASH complex subunit DAD2
MAHHPRPTGIFPPSGTGSSFRQPSIHSNASQQQSSALGMRVEAKRAELENLKQLRDLSSTLSLQMQALEEKLGTLRDGTEGWLLCGFAGSSEPFKTEKHHSTNIKSVQLSLMSSQIGRMFSEQSAWHRVGTLNHTHDKLPLIHRVRITRCFHNAPLNHY